VIKTLQFWWQKVTSALSGADVAKEQQSRYNALLGADPKKVISAITAYNAGRLAELALIIEEYELRDDKMRTCSKKLRASVARCDYSILKRKGYEGDKRAELHAEILQRFWSGVKATSRFKQDECGGFALLVKQMMEAESMGFTVHEIIWRILGNGELAAEFIKIPLWHFENKTGKLRFLETTSETDGIEMKEGEWLVSTGDGIGIAASICACLKRCTLGDWAVFCERCGMPFFIGKTNAGYQTKQWNNLNAALAAIGRDARLLVDKATEIQAIQTGGNGNQPYSPLVEWADRAISSLYRGADLSTMSGEAQATGASLQGDEMGIIEQDACQRLSETLHEKVEKFVIRFVTGDTEPLARIKIEPMKKPNIETEIKIDRHLIGCGAKLSKAEALARYGRSEASGEKDEPMEIAKKEKTGNEE